ncbi:hypothetical protein SLA2020_452750 [Shorea laevis]
MSTSLPSDVLVEILSRLPPKSLLRFRKFPLGPVHFLIRPNYYVKLVASCNGLLCLYEFRTRDVYLWNPTTPSIGFNAIPRLSPHPFSVGFGFDPNSGDFKVVSLRHVASDTGTVALVAGVYSLSRRCWRLLDLRVPYGICAHSETLGLGRVFLWLAEQDGGQIISFDFTDEVFRTTPLPYSRDALDVLEIWVLLEFGVKESWTRFVCIEPPMDLERPLGFWKNGKLFMENSEGQLVLYDPFTQTKKNLGIEGLKDSLEVVLYTQSSVAINGEVELVGEDNL